MSSRDRSAARLITAGVGLTCLASAVAFARRPRAAARAVHLPEDRATGGFIAARDTAIGVLLLIPSTQRRALALRASSDALDAALMTREVLRGRRSLRTTGPLIAGALALSGFGIALRARLAEAD